MTEENFVPAYMKTYEKGLFPDIAQKAHDMLLSCKVCPRNCGIDRTQDETGFCSAGYLPEVSSCSPHFGEEAPLCLGLPCFGSEKPSTREPGARKQPRQEANSSKAKGELSRPGKVPELKREWQRSSEGPSRVLIYPMLGATATDFLIFLRS